MKNYKNENPEFSDSIKIYENTDPVDADSVDNIPLKQLGDNDNFLKSRIDNMKLATKDEVMDVAEELMDGSSPEPSGDIATDEEVEETIENLDDL